MSYWGTFETIMICHRMQNTFLIECHKNLHGINYNIAKCRTTICLHINLDSIKRGHTNHRYEPAMTWIYICSFGHTTQGGDCAFIMVLHKQRTSSRCHLQIMMRKMEKILWQRSKPDYIHQHVLWDQNKIILLSSYIYPFMRQL
jgi:hypothetical protein